MFRAAGWAAFMSMILALAGCQGLVACYDITHHLVVTGYVTATAFKRGGRSPIMQATIEYRPDPASTVTCSGSANLPFGVRVVVGQAVRVVGHANECTPVLVDYVGHPYVMVGFATAFAAAASVTAAIAYRRRWPNRPNAGA